MGGKLLFRGNSNSGLDWIGFTSGNFLLKATIQNKTIKSTFTFEEGEYLEALKKIDLKVNIVVLPTPEHF